MIERLRVPGLSAPVPWAPILWSALWLLAVWVALAARPLLPMEETRYLGIAWEMWTRGSFLVPALNGEPFGAKPPLLFWLIHLGWAIGGVDDTWPRLVGPLAGLASLFLTAWLARLLWPGLPLAAALAPLILSGGIFWTVLVTVTMLDMLAVLFTLTSAVAVLLARRRGDLPPFLMLAASVGLAILAKGPVVLLFILPIVLASPWWSMIPPPPVTLGERRSWMVEALRALILGVMIALLWAVPAAIHGGAEYAHAIFWRSAFESLVGSSDGREPWWYYATGLPLLLLPFTAWPPFWRALVGLPRRVRDDAGVRLCLVWLLPALGLFSALPDKWYHYLLPAFPAVALLVGSLLARLPHRPGQINLVPAAFLLFMAPGFIVLLAPTVAVMVGEPQWGAEVSIGWGAVPLAAGLSMIFLPLNGLKAQVSMLAAATVLLSVSVHMIARPRLTEAYDLSPIAAHLGSLESQDIPLAVAGPYHGQYHFLGRLRRPLPVLQDPARLAEWLTEHPNGRVVTPLREEPADAATPEFIQPFRTGVLAVWRAADLMEESGILPR